jgi:ribonuclease VapC
MKFWDTTSTACHVIVDTSALLAILFQEPEARRIAKALAGASKRRISAASILEVELVVAGRTGGVGSADIDRLVRNFQIEIVPFDLSQARLARAAVRSFGKGHHPARLNFGDCFAYALAIEKNEPLLFKGTDFSQTNIDVAAY